MSVKEKPFTVDEQFSIKCADHLGGSVTYDPFTPDSQRVIEAGEAYNWNPEQEDWSETYE